MKKKLVTIFLLLTIVLSCVFVFVACGDSKNDIIGTWRGSNIITINKNHTGTIESTETLSTFSWKFKNKKTSTYNNGDTRTTFLYILQFANNSKNETFEYICEVDKAKNVEKYIYYNSCKHYVEKPDTTNPTDIVGNWVCQDFDYSKDIYVSNPKNYLTIKANGTFNDSYGDEHGTWRYDTKWRCFLFDTTAGELNYTRCLNIYHREDGNTAIYWFLNYYYKQ